MEKGFTLIELLVVVLIIGILAAIALPQYTASVEKSRAAGMMPLLRAARDANARYFLATGYYASSFDDLDIEVPGTDTDCSAAHCKINDKYTYRLFTDNGLVQFSKPDMVTLEYYPDNSAVSKSIMFRCLANKTNTVGNKVCKSLGGILNSASSSGNINYYDLK